MGGATTEGCAMEFAIGFLIGASLGCSFGYVLSAIIRTAKEADIIRANLRSAQLERECEPELPLAA
jgi:NhaP-type Na+/H+ or K+/H+ antiporter